jgi:hypothetical protein
MRQGNKSSASRFIHTARDWFRFAGALVRPSLPACHFDSALQEFQRAMHFPMGLAAVTNQVPPASR